MDIMTLTALLTPCLPFLIRAAESASTDIGKDIGKDAWATAKKIWDKLKPKLDQKSRPELLQSRWPQILPAKGDSSFSGRSWSYC